MFCPNCGNNIPDGERFCRECGTPIPVSAPTNTVPTHTDTPSAVNIPTPQPTADNAQSAPSGTTNGFYTQPTPTIGNTEPAVPTANNYAQENHANYEPQPAPLNPISQPNYTAQPQAYTPPTIPAPMMTASTAPAAVAEPKSKKKLMAVIITVLVIIALAVAGFFVFKFIQNQMEKQYMKDNPTAYTIKAYANALDNFTAKDEVVSTLLKDTGKKTFKVDFTSNQKTGTFLFGMDKDSKKYYVSSQFDKNNFELFKTPGKYNVKAAADSQSFDYYLDTNNLSENAKNSIFSPSKDNVLGIEQEQFDEAIKFIESLEAVSNANAEQERKNLVEKIGKTIDQYGNATVTEESTTIDNATVNADVITHTFKDGTVVKQLVTDVKDWAQTSTGLDTTTKNSLISAIDGIDWSKVNLTPKDTSFQVVLKTYLNKDNHGVMKVTFSVTQNSTTASMNVVFGANPKNSNKITLETTEKITVREDAETSLPSTSDYNIKVELVRESDNTQDKYSLTVTGDSNMSTQTNSLTYTRNKSTGEFVISTNSSDGSAQDLLNGTITVQDNAVTVSVKTGATNTVSVYISNKFEANEFTSDKNILDMTKEEFEQLTQNAISGSGSLYSDYLNKSRSYDPYDRYEYSYPSDYAYNY